MGRRRDRKRRRAQRRRLIQLAFSVYEDGDDAHDVESKVRSAINTSSEFMDDRSMWLDLLIQLLPIILKLLLGT